MSNLAATTGREKFFLIHKKLLDFDTAYIVFGTVFFNATQPYCVVWADHVFVAGLRKTGGNLNQLETEINLNIYLEH